MARAGLSRSAVVRIALDPERTVDGARSDDHLPEHGGVPVRPHAVLDEVTDAGAATPGSLPLEPVAVADLLGEGVEPARAHSARGAQHPPRLPAAIECRRDRDERAECGEEQRERRAGHRPQRERPRNRRDRREPGEPGPLRFRRMRGQRQAAPGGPRLGSRVHPGIRSRREPRIRARPPRRASTVERRRCGGLVVGPPVSGALSPSPEAHSTRNDCSAISTRLPRGTR